MKTRHVKIGTFATYEASAAVRLFYTPTQTCQPSARQGSWVRCKMEVTELDGRVPPVPTAPSIVGSNRVAPAPVDLEQGGEPPPAETDVGAELQLMQPPAGSTTASDQPRSGSMLASKSGLKSAQAAWLEIRHDATELPHAVRQKVRLARAC